MIRDWLRNIRMDFASEQAYIPQRVIQEQGGWQSHLNKTKEYIVSAIKQNNPKTVRILGSGWLFDLPLDFLLEQCDSIVLCDILHPSQITHKYSSVSKIKFETTDLTFGAVDLAYNLKRNEVFSVYFNNALKNITPINYNEDLVISLNLLSQLSAFITDYLVKKQKTSYNQLTGITTIIQQNHLNGLPKGKSILITDYEEEYLDENGLLAGTKPTVYIDIPRSTGTKFWDWQFDTQMTYKEDCKTNLKVIATTI